MLERARDDVELWLERGYGMVSVLDEEYPARLRDVREAPAILYYEGDLRSTDQGVCVVGSRQADEAALEVASYVSRALVEAGLTVVSGLAAGIDGSHQRLGGWWAYGRGDGYWSGADLSSAKC